MNSAENGFQYGFIPSRSRGVVRQVSLKENDHCLHIIKTPSEGFLRPSEDHTASECILNHRYFPIIIFQSEFFAKTPPHPIQSFQFGKKRRFFVKYFIRYHPALEKKMTINRLLRYITILRISPKLIYD